MILTRFLHSQDHSFTSHPVRTLLLLWGGNSGGYCGAPSPMSELSLRIEKEYPNDVGRGIARLTPDALRELGVNVGDVILITGEKTTVAKAWRADRTDWDDSIIRIDKYVRENAGVHVDDRVSVSPATLRDAEHLVVTPTNDFDGQINTELVKALRRNLLQRPVVQNDIITVSEGERPGISRESLVPLIVLNAEPDQVVTVTPATTVEVHDSPVEMEATMPDMTTYESIGGLDDELDRVREMIELPINHPSVFEKLGIDPPNGVLFYGPPGTGKTLVARAVANEVDATFLSIDGPEIISKYYGESEKELRETFEEAREETPSVLFIDELDSVAPKRDDVTGEVERRIVSQLLTLMDGLDDRTEVIVIGATNRQDAIDSALRRPGRFDREIEFGVPNEREREEILNIHTCGMPLGDDVDVKHVARKAEGFVGADIESLTTEAAMHTLRRYLPDIDIDDDELPPSLLNQLEIAHGDFDDVTATIEPSALRELGVEVPDVQWDDIGGLSAAKQDLRESIVWPVESPSKFERLGIDAPSGVLLYGPPGTGKTLLAKAVATETDTNFIPVNGPEVLSKWVGESEQAIRDLFEQAQDVAPTVLFFDELDSLAGTRSTSTGGATNERVVNQLLTELDGLESLADVVVIGATNRPDMLDPALLRTGRFDRLVHVGPPDFDDREKILKIHTEETPLASNVSLRELAERTDGYVGSDLESLSREAAIDALRENPDRSTVAMRHFEAAMEDIRSTMTPALSSHYDQIEDEFERGQSTPGGPTQPRDFY